MRLRRSASILAFVAALLAAPPSASAGGPSPLASPSCPPSAGTGVGCLPVLVLPSAGATYGWVGAIGPTPAPTPFDAPAPSTAPTPASVVAPSQPPASEAPATDGGAAPAVTPDALVAGASQPAAKNAPSATGGERRRRARERSSTSEPRPSAEPGLPGQTLVIDDMAVPVLGFGLLGVAGVALAGLLWMIMARRRERPAAAPRREQTTDDLLAERMVRRARRRPAGDSNRVDGD